MVLDEISSEPRALEQPIRHGDTNTLEPPIHHRDTNGIRRDLLRA